MRMATCNTYIQAIVYIALLFFFVPIKINGPDELETQFEEYLKTFNKTYENPEVYRNRLEAFKKSVQTINFLNSNKTNNSSAVYGLTKYSDLHPNEFLENYLQANLSQKLFLYYPNSKSVNTNERQHRKKSTVPEKIDWRNKKAVTKVHNQGNCGACWAYSVVETIESMYAIKTKNLEDFSVEQIIDCAGNNNGCEGGDICSLLQWMKTTNFSLVKKTDYHGKGQCNFNSSEGVQINLFMCESFHNLEDIMLSLLATHGPLSVAINAQTWQNYIGGVIEYHCDDHFSALNHAVQIVGYDLTADIPYYIVRNSWGADFGDHGYLYIAIGKNVCGLANEVSALSVL